MKLESISPLTTNSSSELFVFKNQSVKSIQKVLDLIPKSEKVDCSVQTITNYKELCDLADSLYFYISPSNFLRSIFGNTFKVINPYTEYSRPWERNNYREVQKEFDHVLELNKENIEKHWSDLVVLCEDDNKLMSVLYDSEKETEEFRDKWDELYPIIHEHLG